MKILPSLMMLFKRHCVVLIPDQVELSPKSQYNLTKRFDPTIPEPKDTSGGYGHGKV